MKKRIAIAALTLTGSLVAGGGTAISLAADPTAARVATNPAGDDESTGDDEGLQKGGKEDDNCRETAATAGRTGYVYLYDETSCGGAHGAKDNGNDSDYGDGKGKIKKFDNKASSVLNLGDKPVLFYTYPRYGAGKKGDAFCLAPGHWVNQLWRYGDGHRSWANSISSHRWVSAKSCPRWFGWH